MSNFNTDPVFFHPGGQIGDEYRHPGWYFWDETWADCIGPYPTEEACREGLNLYSETL